VLRHAIPPVAFASLIQQTHFGHAPLLINFLTLRLFVSDQTLSFLRGE
jgi:hypothetical protein